jgi:hypothetical protein
MARTVRAMHWLLAAVIAGALLMVAPGSAHADGADVDHEVFTATATIPFQDACTGVVIGTVTIDFKEVQHEVVRPTGTLMTRINLHGDFTLVPDDPALQTVTGHFTSVLERTTGGNNLVDGTVLNAVGRTADGTKIRTHVITHHTENGLGVTVVDFVKGCD